MERPFLAALSAAAIAVLALLAYNPRPSIELLRFSTPILTSINGSNDWDILRHLGGNSPWIQKTRGVVKDGVEAPEGCMIDQIHIMSRHGERYPTMAPGIRMIELYHRLKEDIRYGDLDFVNNWDFFAPHPNDQFEQLTSTGPYAGTLQSFAAGVKLRTRYERLLATALQQGKVSFWASISGRVIDTAHFFATGFFGLDWETKATLHIIPEDQAQGGNTLTPGRACPNYGTDRRGHEDGVSHLFEFRSTYLPAISKRLQVQNPKITFTDDEIYSMQEICGFETLAKGSSEWCSVFTRDEMESFEYARDVLHYYRAGPGNRYGPSMGWLWLNATAELLRQGPAAGPMFISFNHDGDIVALLAALDLISQHPHLPTTDVFHNRTWRLSDVTPMGGRIIFERFVCPATQKCTSNAEYGYPNHVYCEPPSNDTFVRININDGIVPIPNCQDGKGGSCLLENFLEKVKKRGEEIEPFAKICGLPEDVPKKIEFLHQ